MHLFGSKKERVVNPPVLDGSGAIGTPLLGYVDEESSDKVVQCEIRPSMSKTRDQKCYYLNLLLYVLELPLSLPRRLTIPAVSEEKWSKPFAYKKFQPTKKIPIAMACRRVPNEHSLDIHNCRRIGFFTGCIRKVVQMGARLQYPDAMRVHFSIHWVLDWRIIMGPCDFAKEEHAAG
ncbi:unnamed protein product [Fraxinus pennsylvanica]|uniref:Uncharacterized protein n=1 Tax=Fraxinus pennsylvanica TaxID=56036 RepID=A0AAD1YSS5_9LAMI|nr:unnamed protein product [Fraxinus pennsylvanica]